MKRKLKCILLVDDNDSDNFLHKKVIEKSQLADHVAIALNGQEAIDFLTSKGKGMLTESAQCQPELIFLDINMPIMDGWEFLEEYQNLSECLNEKSTIIILTTSLNPEDKSKAEKMLESDCFQFKPLTLQMLNNILENHFPEYL
jgi:CheY-like chemotaxis protein